MSRRKRCRNFLWRDENPTYQVERDNDRMVFRKIKRELVRSQTKRKSCLTKIIRRLFKDGFWASRMIGKTPEAWRVNYYRWRREKCSGVQAK